MNDYNFGTLIRKDAEKLYAEDNTILVTRVQFFAIEVSILLLFCLFFCSSSLSFERGDERRGGRQYMD